MSIAPVTLALTTAALAAEPGMGETPARPGVEFPRWMVGRIAADTAKVDRADEHEKALRDLAASRAKCLWMLDEQVAVERLAEGLRRRPALVARTLRGSRHGCLWLRERWEALARPLRQGTDWSDDQRARALDLLGVAAELRDASTLVDFPGPDADRIAGRLELAGRQLEGLADASAEDGDLAVLDAEAYRMAAKGMPARRDPEVEAARREGARAQRRIQWACAQLKARPEAAEPKDSPCPVDDDPAPAPAPVETSDADVARLTRDAERMMAAIKAKLSPGTSPRPAPPAPTTIVERTESRQQRRKRERSEGRA